MSGFIKKHKKLFALIVFVAVICLGLLFDYGWSYTYNIELVSISPSEPVADSRQPVEITLKLTHFGKAVEGHSLYTLPQNGGKISTNIVKTDADGLAVFIYYPYTETALMKAQPITFYSHDENNSVIFEINTKLVFVIDLKSKE